MIKLFLAYDNLDETLGDFFEKCAQKLKELLSHEFELDEMRTYSLNHSDIQTKLSIFTDRPFIFTAFSHGDGSNLISFTKYLSVDHDLAHFSNSLFYTFSCLSGVDLSFALIQNGCKCFIGYSDKVYIETGYEDIFIDCSLTAFKVLIDGGTTEQAYLVSLNKYDESIDMLSDRDEPLIALTLKKNRDSFIVEGDFNLSFSHFHYSN